MAAQRRASSWHGWALGLLALALSLAAPVQAATAGRRVAVVVGANAAATGRTALRYAHQDARQVAAVLTEVGDFRTEDVVVLLDPEPDAVLAALDRQRAALGRVQGETMLLFYYSGHADERALYPAGRALPLEALRERVDGTEATVRVGIIDACRGGSWTQAKGLQQEAQAFEVKLPLELRSEGSVLIASSSGLESAHEAEAVEGSFFTHHLVAGLRGAADQADDGEVSIVEAFGYARQLTVRDTALLSAGPQHPSFDLNLRGRSDLVMTRVRAAPSHLRLRQGAGRLRVLQAATGTQVAELSAGQQAALLALPPGRYLVVRREAGEAARAREVTLVAGQTVSVDESSLEPVHPALLGLKGGAPRPYNLTLSLLPGRGLLVAQGFGFELERALGEHYSLALSPYWSKAGLGAHLTARYFIQGQAPEGFFMGPALLSEAGSSAGPGGWLWGVGVTGGYTRRFGPVTLTGSLMPLARWVWIGEPHHEPPDYQVHRLSPRPTEVRLQLGAGVAF